jgi:hypothetical protein
MVERRTALDICQNQVTTYRRNRPTVPVTDATSPRKVNLAKQAEQTAATADAPGAGQLSSIPSGAAAMLASTSAFLESNAALSHGIRLPEGDILQGIAFGIMAAAMQVVADNSLGADRFVAQLDA